jgi:hypothetical protein
MLPNFPVLLLAALVPLAVGFVWYSDKVMGRTWMKIAEMTEEKMAGANMAVVFGVTYVLSVMLAMLLNVIVIHQGAIYSVLMNEPGYGQAGSEVEIFIKGFMDKYGQNFRTFQHGAFHGLISALFFALPVLGINALFERRGWRYIAIHTVYWSIVMALMGGIICAYA